MSMTSLSLRHGSRPPPPAAPSSLRLEVCPPSLREAPESIWHGLLNWLLAPAPQDVRAQPHRLQPVRRDFHACIADVTVVPDAGNLVRRVETACTLRELWHLRAEVYRLVALQFSQAEAEERLASLNHHFPTRAPRSAFAPL